MTMTKWRRDTRMCLTERTHSHMCGSYFCHYFHLSSCSSRRQFIDICLCFLLVVRHYLCCRFRAGFSFNLDVVVVTNSRESNQTIDMFSFVIIKFSCSGSFLLFPLHSVWLDKSIEIVFHRLTSAQTRLTLTSLSSHRWNNKMASDETKKGERNSNEGEEWRKTYARIAMWISFLPGFFAFNRFGTKRIRFCHEENRRQKRRNSIRWKSFPLSSIVRSFCSSQRKRKGNRLRADFLWILWRLVAK